MLSSKWAWLNVFQYCKFLRLLGHVMVLLVLGIVAFTYYTVVALQYAPGIVSGGFLSAVGCTLVVVLFTAVVSAAWSRHRCEPPRTPAALGTAHPGQLGPDRRRWRCCCGRTWRPSRQTPAGCRPDGTRSRKSR
jgi:hypothetical protein